MNPKELLSDLNELINQKDLYGSTLYNEAKSTKEGILITLSWIEKEIENNFKGFKEHHFGDDEETDHPEMPIHKSDLLAFEQKLVQRIREAK